MGEHGGLQPGVERYGGGNRRLQRIIESLNAQRGTAYNTDVTSTVYIDNAAAARGIDAAWATNARVAAICDPYRTPLLERWEKILALPSTGTESERRARFAELLSRHGKEPTESALVVAISAALGPVFVALEHIPLTDALVYWPGGTPNADFPWMSTVAHLLVHVEASPGMSEGQFYDAVGGLFQLMDARVTAWDTSD